MALNQKAVEHARELIRQGKVDRTSRWSFDASDGNALLGPKEDWDAYALWFLLETSDGGGAMTKDRFKYPFGKDGKLYRSALVAIRQRAAQQNEKDVFDAAGELLKEVDAQFETHAREAVQGKGGESGYRVDGRFRADLGELAPASAPSGLVWEAVLIAPGLSLSNPAWYWSEEVLRAAAAVFQGVDVNAYELTPEFLSHLPIPQVDRLEDVKRYLAANKAGWIENPRYAAGQGIVGEIRFLPAQSWVPETIRAGMAGGNGDVLGLSIDARVKGIPVQVDGALVLWATEIVSASSVDVVTRPAAGGKFLRAVQALTEAKETRMDREKLLALIKEKRPEVLEGKDTSKITDEEVLALARRAMEPKEKPDETRAAQGIDPAKLKSTVDEAIANAVRGVEERAACAELLGETIAASGLPKPAADRIRSSFKGKIFKKEELDAAVKAEKEYLAGMAALETQSRFGDQTRASGGIGQRDKIEMAVDRVFGLTDEDITRLGSLRRLDGRPFFEGMRAAQDYSAISGIALPSGLRELYVLLTGDAEVTGFFNRQGMPGDLRAAQDITSGTFSFILGNTLGRRLVKDYLATDFKESLLISIRKPVKDFRQQEAVLVGYFGDLDTVDPEAVDYQEIAGVTDEESNYTIAQKGNILTITRKTIINDDISLIQRLVSRLGRAARRTHAKYVWTFFTGNANCSDGTAWFTVGHSNLGAVALSFANAISAYQALAKMTEKDSGERIGLLDDPSVKPNLIYPVDLLQTGESVANDDFYFSSNDLTTKTRNPMKGKVNAQCVTLLTDATDWGLLLPPETVDMVEMGYLNGRQEPEMFLADSPQSEQVFIADKVRYKIRHEYAGAVIDYRSGYKSVT